MKDHTNIPQQICPECGYKMDCTAAAFGASTPRAGDITMCLSCGEASIFDQDLVMHKPGPVEARRISLLPELIQAQLVRAHLVGDKLRKRKQ